MKKSYIERGLRQCNFYMQEHKLLSILRWAKEFNLKPNVFYEDCLLRGAQMIIKEKTGIDEEFF